LLTTTDLTMAQVAKRTGFASNKRFSEEFRREANLRPSEYRHKSDWRSRASRCRMPHERNSSP